MNKSEYGFAENHINISFQPSEFGILENYSVEKELYKVQLSPTIITLTRRKDNDQVNYIFMIDFVESDKKEHSKR